MPLIDTQLWIANPLCQRPDFSGSGTDFVTGFGSGARRRLVDHDRGVMMIGLVAVLFPHPAGLRIDGVLAKGGVVRVEAST
ncbi:hypothetical protein [Amycolatopsis magusensis]|uniref:Uncharacterized protein n=1 Tax=Amycolatopsis magusensis TaxID=882444 RepID=A0ABS4PND1_9PSEU|nr:hypothetical protein [Amycolatopsis magusensis]MBP2180131.1 hypothetical protein [Amycolatopsis magusensis]